ncbi:peroxidase [Phormidium sp. LEGE 05292]|uniref:peroxidase n=1 Tax=[Phormidium] sp. LEGE 05292 TaxID=767427 RepID=UPI0018801A01|nr:peroxidase [Phormidium sp. LEGE 05292]MBE9224888.1 peroxidase [Phormidium sp. LEGE 05292]
MIDTNDNSEQDYQSLIDNPDPVDADDQRYEQIFKDLQGGIIKNYGRNYYLYIFIFFNQEKIEQAKQWIRDEIANSVTSTYKQLQDTEDYRQNLNRALDSSPEEIHPGEKCKNFFLSYQGYKILFKLENKKNVLDEPLFEKGMKSWWTRNYQTNKKDNDAESPRTWDIGGGKHEIHGLILLAHNCLEELKYEAELIIEEFERRAVGNIIACEVGYKLVDEKKRVVGPFGFVDGVSQPLFLKRDYEKYCNNQDTDKWDPKASLNLVLVKDPFGEPYSFGSYCVWQKLETDYECFKKKEKELSDNLKCDSEKAAALVVGRFRDGTPIALSEHPNQDSIKNNFNYNDDPQGMKCPLHGHIRKVNPRGEQTKNPNDDLPHLEQLKKYHRIFRAGITYFDKSKVQKSPDSKILDVCLNKLKYLKEVRKELPEDNIKNISGLLFVCFQSSIVNQFQKLQNDWADNDKFPREFSMGESKYLDPVIGHPLVKGDTKNPKPQEWFNKCSGEDVRNYPFYGCVKNKGGEFFFAPSISFLKKF